MLSHLHIRNLAVLDEVELDLRSGFTALTGETGAGKSMLVDALALALGERADSSAVRSGAERAEVTAIFEFSRRPDLQQWLRDNDLDAAEECQLRRIVTQEGRSRGYINDQPVAMDTLRGLGEQLVEICSQHAHQSLRHRSVQRNLLDAHGGHSKLVQDCAAAYAAWRGVEDRRQALLAAQRDGEQRRELLSHQVGELEALRLQPGEVQRLEREHRLLANRGRIAEGLQLVLGRLFDDEQHAAQDAVAVARREVQALTELDPELRAAGDSLEQAAIQIAEAVAAVRDRLEALEHDPGREQEIGNRLATIQDLARKHRLAAEELPDLLVKLSAELQQLSNAGSLLEELELETARLKQRLGSAATALTKARRAAADSFSEAVTGNLHRLGIADGKFEAAVQTSSGEPGPDGADQVEFLISTNAGQPPGPLTRVASGGELSRISLAIQVLAMAQQGASTLIFDEVDAGVGGGVAEIVGACLKELSVSRQVLCVTHLAQVASQADQHVAVRKSVVRNQTHTTLASLSGTERVEEIARMLGGVTITPRTRAHANEMLKSARRAG